MTFMVVYSYKMLMVPASKVSVPLTVVMRTCVRVSESVLPYPLTQIVLSPVADPANDIAHALLPIALIVQEPYSADAADHCPAKVAPAVLVAADEGLKEYPL
jgi:hypothetical protein